MWRFEEEIGGEISLNVPTLRFYDMHPKSANVTTSPGLSQGEFLDIKIRTKTRNRVRGTEYETEKTT